MGSGGGKWFIEVSSWSELNNTINFTRDMTWEATFENTERPIYHIIRPLLQ
jgi:hypothetical protein